MFENDCEGHSAETLEITNSSSICSPGALRRTRVREGRGEMQSKRANISVACLRVT